MRDADQAWPELPLEEWRATCATLHMWTQVVGKVRMACMPRVNHWWNVTLYLSGRGLTTGAMTHGQRTFQIDFDFVEHRMVVAASDGGRGTIALEPRTVADFHRELMALLDRLGLGVRIWTTPVEVADPIPFERDTDHAAYDAEYANRFWRVLAQSARVLERFRSGFVGKSSPVHFFWGSFDLALTRFSGRPAPPHPGAPNVADAVTREAYSHEVWSAGFWPGGGPFPDAAFYAYAYPEPPGFRAAPLAPDAAFYAEALGEHLLPYAEMRATPDPDAALLAFLEVSYGAAAELGAWDRAALERRFGVDPPSPSAPGSDARPVAG